MHKEHPVPNTPATKAPKVDGFVTDYLKAAFPKSDDGELIKVQSALLKVCGPMACMWAELIDNKLLSDADATVNVHDVFNIIQRTIVLLGNANEMLSQSKRSKILAAVDTSLVKYGQKPQPESGEFLFGSEFTKYLRGEVETDSSLAEVVSHDATILTTMHVNLLLGGPKSVFSRGPWQEVGASAGQLSDPIKLPITPVTKRQFILQIKGEKPTLLGPTKEILDQLPQSRELLLLLGLDITQMERHACTPVGGRLAQFAHDWRCLTRDPWVLESIQGYGVPLNHWPQRSMVPCMQLREDQSQALKAEVKNLIEKGAVVPVSKSQIQLTSPPFVVPKSGGGWRPIIDLRRLNQYLRPPHFKMEGLHMLPNVVRQNFFMAKVDLKDAYLTVAVSAEFHCLLGFQDNGQLLQFQTLPFGLCTAPYAFSKITKPAVQFLRQAGIHIIIYLDDMLLVSPTESSLAQDLSTVLWLFSSLGFLINIPKTTVVPSSEIEFL